MGIFDFLKPSKNIENDNGLNQYYFDKGKGNLKLRFNKKNGKINGLFEIFILDGKTAWLIGNFKDGLLHGELKEWSTSGQCFRMIEKWEMGEKKSWEAFYTGSSNRGKLAKKGKGGESFLKDDIDRVLKEFSIKNN